jgi:hypothetical protein
MACILHALMQRTLLQALTNEVYLGFGNLPDSLMIPRRRLRLVSGFMLDVRQNDTDWRGCTCSTRSWERGLHERGRPFDEEVNVRQRCWLRLQLLELGNYAPNECDIRHSNQPLLRLRDDQLGISRSWHSGEFETTYQACYLLGPIRQHQRPSLLIGLVQPGSSFCLCSSLAAGACSFGICYVLGSLHAAPKMVSPLDHRRCLQLSCPPRRTLDDEASAHITGCCSFCALPDGYSVLQRFRSVHYWRMPYSSPRSYADKAILQE